MPRTLTRRYRRRSSSSSREGGAFKKDNAQEQTFFGNATHETFFQPAATIHRKCEKCEQEEKQVHRATEKKEEEKVMRMTEKEEHDEEKEVHRAPEKKEEDKPVQRAAENKEEDKTLHRAAGEKEEEKVQKKESATSSNAAATTASGYISSINSRGNAMPKKQQHFFGERMGYDFSNVKIHNDKTAAESAKDISAQAYTYGNHIVFNEGKYNPENSDGKRLMAHELTHVIQNKSVEENNIPRKADFAGGTVTNDVDLAAHYVTAVKTGVLNSYSGITNGFLNGQDLTKAATGPVLKSPVDADITAVKQADGTYKSSITNVPVNSFNYEMHIPTNVATWKAFVDANDIASQLQTACAGKINVYITGDPDSKAVVQKIHDHEDIHVQEWTDAFKILEAYDTEMTNAKGNGKTEAMSKAALVKSFEVRARIAFAKFISAYTKAADDFHKGAGKPANYTAYQQSGCSWVKVRVKVP